MKVNAYKTVDVECEVDVELADCIAEMLAKANDEESRTARYRLSMGLHASWRRPDHMETEIAI